MARPSDDGHEIPTRPQWETRARKPLSGGRWPGIDKSMWLYRAVPMAAVTDARTERDMVAAGDPLAAAFDELAAITHTRMPSRRMSKEAYRQFHALLVSIPGRFRALESSPLRDWLNAEHAMTRTTRRVLLFGVKMRPTTGTGGWRSALASVAETIQSGQTPLSDYDADYEVLDAALARCGFQVPTTEMLHLADSWWNLGRPAGIPVLTHPEHVHYFASVTSGRRMAAIDADDCALWPDGAARTGWHAITFAAVDEFDLGYREATDPVSRWASGLVDAGAHAVSIRGAVEPTKITRNELRGQIRRYQADLEEQAASNKLDRNEIREKESELTQVEQAYAPGGGAGPTLTNVSIIAAFDGIVPAAEAAPAGLSLSPMLNRQAAAWHEMMVCSAVRANPLTHDLPASTVAYSGLPDLDRLGDQDGALLGLTERDRQPVYISPTAASSEDASPLLAVYGATGSGKTVTMQLLADQFDRLARPQLIVNPKQGASLADFVAYGSSAGRPRTVLTLSGFESSDGGLDPIRIFPDKSEAVNKAASMIASVNPFGDQVRSVMTDIAYAIDYGVKHGAQATGQALAIAREAGIIEASITDKVFRYAEAFPMFRATFGIGAQESPLQLSDGMTLIEVGESSFQLPPDGYAGEAGALLEPAVRNSLNIIRMLIWGGMAALRNRGGVIHFDESWVMEKAAPSDLDQIGRLARAWNVLPILYTQKPTGQHAVGLKGYISRGLIGHIRDEREAQAALEMFNLGDNQAMLRRITAGDTSSDGAQLNFDSLRALRQPGGRGIVRGSVFYHVDLRGRVAPVEVVLNPEFLKISSTTPEDVARRHAEREMRQAAMASVRAPAH